MPQPAVSADPCARLLVGLVGEPAARDGERRGQRGLRALSRLLHCGLARDVSSQAEIPRHGAEGEGGGRHRPAPRGGGRCSPSNELTATADDEDALVGTHRCTPCASPVCPEETQPPSFYKATLQMETTTGQRVGFYSHLDHNKRSRSNSPGCFPWQAARMAETLCTLSASQCPTGRPRSTPASQPGSTNKLQPRNLSRHRNHSGCRQVSPCWRGRPGSWRYQIRAQDPSAATFLPSPIQWEIFSVHVSTEQQPSPKAAPGDTLQAPAAPGEEEEGDSHVMK